MCANLGQQLRDLTNLLRADHGIIAAPALRSHTSPNAAVPASLLMPESLGDSSGAAAGLAAAQGHMGGVSEADGSASPVGNLQRQPKRAPMLLPIYQERSRRPARLRSPDCDTRYASYKTNSAAVQRPADLHRQGDHVSCVLQTASFRTSLHGLRAAANVPEEDTRD